MSRRNDTKTCLVGEMRVCEMRIYPLVDECRDEWNLEGEKQCDLD